MLIARFAAATSVAAAISLCFTLTVQPVAFAGDQGGHVTASDIAQAMHDTGLASQSSGIKAASDASDAAISTANGTTVDISKSASDGVEISYGNNSTLHITPPNSGNSQAGTVVEPGVVAYPSESGAATAVQTDDDGGVRMMTVIGNANAPTRYSYRVNIPDGGQVKLTHGGGAMVINAIGRPIAGVAAPWAKDANGNPVPTHFTVDANGTTLIQIINHRVGGVVYPVTADPFWSGLGNYLLCITGVGVPIGLAIVIAALPQTWPAISTWAANQSARGDRSIITYVTKVYNACRRFFKS